jgi:hypothetical protein
MAARAFYAYLVEAGRLVLTRPESFPAARLIDFGERTFARR